MSRAAYLTDVQWWGEHHDHRPQVEVAIADACKMNSRGHRIMDRDLSLIACKRQASAPVRIMLVQRSPAARSGRRVRGSCRARQLLPPASLLHNAACPHCPPVAAPTLRLAPVIASRRIG